MITGDHKRVEEMAIIRALAAAQEVAVKRLKPTIWENKRELSVFIEEIT